MIMKGFGSRTPKSLHDHGNEALHHVPLGCVTGALNGRRVAVLRVGLTGGIGSGKSEVSRRLADHGAVLIDADVAAREVVVPGSPGLAQIAEGLRR